MVEGKEQVSGKASFITHYFSPSPAIFFSLFFSFFFSAFKGQEHSSGRGVFFLVFLTRMHGVFISFYGLFHVHFFSVSHYLKSGCAYR